MRRADEFATKVERLRAFLTRSGFSAVWLRRRANIAWLGSGPPDGVSLDTVQGSRSEVFYQAETGVASFVVTPERVALLTETIELPRLTRDEFGGLDLDVVVQPWHAVDPVASVRAVLGSGPGIGPVATDLLDAPLDDALAERGLHAADRRDEIAVLRAELLPREIERYRWLGGAASRVMTAVCQGIRAGMPESEVVAETHARLRRLGIAQEVDIVCGGDRLYEDRHGLYSDRAIHGAVMIVFSAHKWGLVASLTRTVALGRIPDGLATRHEAVASLERRMMDGTRPGRPLTDLFSDLQAGYADLGTPDAWRQHHQGGPTGYTGRDRRATPTAPGTVLLNQAFAWNPSLPGAKSEDTFVVGEHGPDILTVDHHWPAYGDTGRPAILVVTG